MKPTKNRVYCYGCNKSKMLFESKTKADNFIAFNSEGMLEENGKAPVRSYYCEFCGGYHVTSNRSIADGESMDQRDQEFVDLISSYKQNAKDYNQIHQTVSNMIKKVKRQLCFGNFELADELYEDFQIGPDSLLRLPQKNRSQYMMLRHKVKNLKEFAAQVKELMQLPREEVAEKLAFDDSSKKEKDLDKIMRGYYLMQDCDECIVSIRQLMEEERWADAFKEVMLLRTQMSETKGSAIMKDCVTRNMKEISKLEKEIADAKKKAKEKEAKEREAKKKKSTSKVDVDEKDKTSRKDEAYKASIFSVIERVEKAKQAFEQNDLDACENELEIAEFLLDDFSFDDDNTQLLRDQINMWKKKISES